MQLAARVSDSRGWVFIANQKGGVGKTTTVIHPAYYFSQFRNQRVLTIDLDTQGHVALSFNYNRGEALKEVLLHHKSILEAREEARPNLFQIKNNKSSEELMPYLMNLRQREFALADILEPVKNDYDWVFIDTPPSANILHDLALVSAHYLLVPTVMDYFAIGGLGDTLDTLYAISRLRGVKPPGFLGVLPTRFEFKTNETKAQFENLQKMIGTRPILPPIWEDVKFREASGEGQSLWEAPKKPARRKRLNTSSDQASSRGWWLDYSFSKKINI